MERSKYMLLIKNHIIDDNNEPTANFKTVYCCANCNNELSEDKQFVTKRVPNPYMTEEMRLKNIEYCGGDEEKARKVNEVDEKIIIVCPKCETRNKIHDYRWY